MAKVACEDLDPEFTKNAKAGDIIVGGKNWGCGSSREQAVSCLKEPRNRSDKSEELRAYILPQLLQRRASPHHLPRRGGRYTGRRRSRS